MLRRLFGIKEFALVVLIALGYAGLNGSGYAWITFGVCSTLFVFAKAPVFGHRR